MKRKIFSTLLMGAFVFASLSTVTSCKDYDDDINGLQTELASLKSSVTTLESNVSTATSTANSALSEAQTAKTTAESALAKANAAATQADLDALKARVTAAEGKITDLETEIKKLDDLQSQITDLKAKVEDCATKDELKALQTEFDAIKGQFDALYQMVTSVELIGSYTNGKFVTTELSGATATSSAYDGGYYSHSHNLSGEKVTASSTITMSPFALSFEVGTVGSSDVVFGKDMKDGVNATSKVDNANTPYTYAKNTDINFPKTIVVRVNPANAKFSADQVRLIDSKGNVLNTVKVSSVKPYDQLLTRATVATGLWTVELTPAAANKDLEKTNSDGHILYALGINNTDSAAERYAYSTYDITFEKTTAYKAPAVTKFANVKFTSSQEEDVLSNISSRDVSNGVTRAIGADAFLAASGEDITISFENADLADVDRFYVVLDKNNAESLSSPSEINVWNTYKYAGTAYKEIVEVKNGTGKGTLNITIPSDLKTGDIIAFRLYAAGYDGTLIDANGESFEVKVVNPSNQASVSGDLVATSIKPSTAILPITNASNLTGTTALPSEVTLKVGNTEYVFKTAYYKDAEGEQSASKSSETKYVKFTFNGETIKAVKDGATLTGDIKLVAAGATVDVISVSLKKVLPGDAEAKELGKYTWKGEQLSADNVFTAYLFNEAAGNTWGVTDQTPGTGKNGYKLMGDVLNIGNPIIYVIENAAVDGSKSTDKQVYDQALSVDLSQSSSILTVSNQPDSKGTVLIDNKTEHASKIIYSFGAVSSETDDAITGVVSEFKTVFACPLAKEAQTLAWKQYAQAQGTTPETYKNVDVNYLTWGVDESPLGVKLGEYIVATNSFDPSKFSGTFDGSTYTSKTSGVNKLYKTVVAKLITNSNKNADYFDVEVKNGGVLTFTHKADAQNPLKDVESTLVLTLTDYFGHEVVYELPFTVKPSTNGAKKH